MERAFNGIKVLELASYVTGPFATMFLADAGAEVIKIERPERGDEFRYWGQGDYSPTFCAINRNKKSLTLNLTTVDGKEIFKSLVKEADVLVENFRPGVMARLGLDYETLAGINTKLIYCSISGFGETGPYQKRPGYDTVGQALSGLLGMLTDFDSPKPMGVSISDHLTALYACYGIITALFARSMTGKGQKVETSLLEASISFIGENAARYLATGDIPKRQSRTQLAQVYSFVAGDGLPFIIHLSSPQKFWLGLTEAIEAPELRADERFKEHATRIKNYQILETILAKIFTRKTRDYWLNCLNKADVPCAPIYSLREVFDDPQVIHLDLVKKVKHPTLNQEINLIRNGVRLSETPLEIYAEPPTHGGDTVEILKLLGLSIEQISAYRAKGIV